MSKPPHRWQNGYSSLKWQLYAVARVEARLGPLALDLEELVHPDRRVQQVERRLRFVERVERVDRRDVHLALGARAARSQRGRSEVAISTDRRFRLDVAVGEIVILLAPHVYPY